MDATTPYVYQPIQPYQTRLVWLHGDNGDRDSKLVCSLLIADLLHVKFDGVGVRSSGGQEEALIEYEALSYAWGDITKKPNHMECDGARLEITHNLFEALRALRLPDARQRYLWVDAICINQGDRAEKATQVSNMLEIYQGAREVVVWLGLADLEFEYLLMVAAIVASSDESQLSILVDSGSNTVEPDTALDMKRICSSLCSLYRRAWFQRMWVQQEVHAAKSLIFQCGSMSFRWFGLFSDPGRLRRVPGLVEYLPAPQPRVHQSFMPQSDTVSPVPTEAIVFRLQVVEQAVRLHKSTLQSFERFRQGNGLATPSQLMFNQEPRSRTRPDFVESLLYTQNLIASDARDHVYAILGMSGFPARRMSVAEWMVTRSKECFIPIDYSTDFTTLNIIVSWAIIMKVGFGSIARLKMIKAVDDESSCKLPSWAIDWQTTSQLVFRDMEGQEDRFASIIENATDVVRYENRSSGGDAFMHLKQSWYRNESWSHLFGRQLYIDNSKSGADLTGLTVTGTIEHHFCVPERTVFIGMKPYHIERHSRPNDETRLHNVGLWSLGFDCSSTAIVVCLSATGLRKGTPGPHPFHEQYSGVECLWLLQAADQGTYRLRACLAWPSSFGTGDRTAYWQWKEYSDYAARQVGVHPDDKYHPMSAKIHEEWTIYRDLMGGPQVDAGGELLTFVIV